MALSAGKRLGPYEIVDALGVGGMGEVYRARDTRLNRDVAIKTLLPVVADDPERMVRFTREAQVLAVLNHPNIAQIYGLEESADGTRGLVMELVAGPTLADRLEREPRLDVKPALRIARQVAEALEAAHERGIIHRDLKPANIKVRDDGMVKVLDFGLAKALGSPDAALGSGVRPTNSPTVTSPAMTTLGMILGTAAYMSPEQASGKVADQRSDMWSFGVVLMEMLTGRRLFDGDTISHVLAAVLKDEPDWTTLPSDTPTPIRTLLRRCLEKDPKRRLDSAAAARLEIDDALTAPVEGPNVLPPSRRRVPLWAVAGAASLVTAIASWIWLRPGQPAPLQPSRFAIVPSASQMLATSYGTRDLEISRDGTRLVYIAGGGPRLMVRAIDQLEPRALPGIVTAFTPFLSPDGRWIGFAPRSSDELKRVSITGGAPITICHVADSVVGASWGDDDTIVFATSDVATGLWRVSASGSDPKTITTPDSAAGEIDHLFPSMLPGNRGVLFTVRATGGAANGQIAVLDFKTGQRKTLIRGGSQGEYVEFSAGSGQGGYLVYASGGALHAARFNLAALEVVGDPVLVLDRVMTYPTGGANFSISRNGTLVYAPARLDADRSLVWVTRQGTEEPLTAPVRVYLQPRLSPDGKRVAISTNDRENDIVVWNLETRTLTAVTSGPDDEFCPVWTPDGQRLVFTSSGEGPANIFWQPADGSGRAERLTTSPNEQYPSSMSGDHLIFQENARQTDADLMLLTMPGADHAARATPLLRTSYREANGEISPDGHWLAYQSNESGQNEIYVRQFPLNGDRRWPVSVGGGIKPLWARDGRELFYLNGTSLMSARVQTTPVFSAANPTKIFDGRYFFAITGRTYDVSPDGQRFLMIKSASTDTTATPADMVVVLNWTEELEAKFRK